MKRILLILSLLLFTFPAMAGMQSPRKLVASGGGGGGSTITYVGFWEQTTASATASVTVSGLQANDYIILYTANDISGGGILWPTGFTVLAAIQSTDDSSYFQAAGKVAAGTETTIAIEAGVTNILGCLVFRGVNTTTPQDVTPVTLASAPATSSPFSQDISITPVTNGAMLVRLADWDVTNGSTPVSGAVSGGGLTWTVNDTGEANGYMHMSSGYATQATAAAITVTATGTIASRSAGRAGIQMALRPQ